MKKVILLLVFLVGGYLYGQGIVDYGKYVQFNSTTDTVVIFKDKVAAVWPWSGQVSLIGDRGPIDRHRGTDQALYRVNPTYYGYSTVWECFNVVAPMFGGVYTASYGYDVTSGQPDSIWYIIGSDTAYIWVGTYDGDSLTGSTIVH